MTCESTLQSPLSHSLWITSMFIIKMNPRCCGGTNPSSRETYTKQQAPLTGFTGRNPINILSLIFFAPRWRLATSKSPFVRSFAQGPHRSRDLSTPFVTTTEMKKSNPPNPTVSRLTMTLFHCCFHLGHWTMRALYFTSKGYDKCMPWHDDSNVKMIAATKKAQTWNRAAMAQVLHFCAPQWIAPSWVLQCSPTSHLTCTQDRDSRCIHHYYSWDEDTQTIVPSPTQNGPEIWSTLQRYTQIMTNDMYRVDALLHGMCNDQWRQPAQALDSQGRVGYVYDPTELSTTVSKQQQQDADRGRTAFSSNNVCATPFGNGVEGPDGWNAMSNKIRTTDFPAGTKFKKVLCMVYTHESRHEPYLRAISETWGPKCDGFVAASSVTDTSIGAVRLLHEGPET
mmetsp:Transcript_12442/g.28052  ORF Transcript_12442/g.28052 Transcript_12442/m.28052 type:complete len:396 (+) Transcript_12442:581-1768(+)